MYLRFVVQIFYGNRSYALLLIPFIATGFVILNLYFPYHLPDPQAHFGMWGKLLPQESTISQLLAPAIVVANSIILNTIYNRNDFLEKNNYLVSMLYVSFMAYFHSFYFLDGSLIVQLILCVSLFSFFKLNQNEDARKIVFNLAFWFGLASTFYPLFLLSLPILFSMIWVMRPFVFRESLLTLVGFVLPLVYAGVYNFYFERTMVGADFSSSSTEWYILDIMFIGSAVTWFLLFSVQTLLRKMQQGSIRIRKLYNILMLMGVLTLLLTSLDYFFFNKGQVISLVFVPLMFVLPYGFGYKKQRVAPTIFYYLLLLFAVGKFFNLIQL
jgi:hypothetical protein